MELSKVYTILAINESPDRLDSINDILQPGSSTRTALTELSTSESVGIATSWRTQTTLFTHTT